MLSEEFHSPNRSTNIVATTTGTVTIKNLNTRDYYNITVEEFHSPNKPDYIVATTTGTVTIKNLNTNETYRITLEEFYSPNKPDFIVAERKGTTISEHSRIKIRKPRSEEGKKNIKAGMKHKTVEQRNDVSDRRKTANSINRVCCIITHKEYDLPNFKRWCS